MSPFPRWFLKQCRGLGLISGMVLGTTFVSAVRGGPSGSARPQASAETFWITGYYPGWEQRLMPPAEINFRALTHLVQFAVMPRTNGALDWKRFELSEPYVRETVRLTHAAGRKILLCVGGADSAKAFRGALAEKSRPAFVKNLVEAVRVYDYDGLDIDMEPVEAVDVTVYAAFIHELRAALRQQNPATLLTAAVGELPALFAGLQDQFDQINVMTYAQSGTWDGWVTWHNSALDNGGMKIPGSTRELPGVKPKMREWLAAGIMPKKLGLGVAFYGYAWSGATAPLQSIKGVTTHDLSYTDLMKTYYTPARYHWDAVAGAPYLSVEAAPAAGGVKARRELFISFDDERSLRLKIEYARSVKLGGAIIWEIANDYRADLPAGHRTPLLQAVKDAAGPK